MIACRAGQTPEVFDLMKSQGRMEQMTASSSIKLETHQKQADWETNLLWDEA